VKYHPQKPRRSPLYSLSNITSTIYFITTLLISPLIGPHLHFYARRRHTDFQSLPLDHKISLRIPDKNKECEYVKHTQQEHIDFAIHYTHISA
jgi:hypothetical protein